MSFTLILSSNEVMGYSSTAKGLRFVKEFEACPSEAHAGVDHLSRGEMKLYQKRKRKKSIAKDNQIVLNSLRTRRIIFNLIIGYCSKSSKKKRNQTKN